MSAARQLLTAPQVAARLARSHAWFLRRRGALEETGFPRPVDGCGMRWDPAAIDDWLDAQRPRRAGPEETAEAELIRRAREMGAAA